MKSEKKVILKREGVKEEGDWVREEGSSWLGEG
jgi:hypothetical protein